MKHIASLLALAVLLICAVSVPKAVAQSSTSENPCPLTVRMSGLSASTQLINADGQHAIRICYYDLSLTEVVSTSAKLVWGTGTTCATSTAAASSLVANGSAITTATAATSAGDGYGFIDENPSRGISNYCLIITGSAVVWGHIKYGLY